MEASTIEHFVGEEGIEDALVIRKHVFVEEQHVPEEREQDGLDYESEHYVGYINSQPVSVARVRILDSEGHHAKIERVAVVREKRGEGLGQQLVHYILEDLQRRGLTEVNLEAQSASLAFYREMGFIATGEEFQDAGVPHRKMYRPLA